MLTPDDINRLIDGGETAAVEFKLAKGGVPASLWESYSAFANTDGGVIVLGVGESGGKRHVVGVANADKMVADIWNAANNPQRVSANDFWNYHGRQGIVIEKRFNRLMFRNPGCLRMSRDAAIAGGRSDARNSRIFNIFALIDIGERSGTGLSDIFSTWRECGYEKPTITETYQPDQLSVVVFVETEVAASATQETLSATQEANGVATETGVVATETANMATETGYFAPKPGDSAAKIDDFAPKNSDVTSKDGHFAPKDDSVATETDAVATENCNVATKKAVQSALMAVSPDLPNGLCERCADLYCYMKDRPSATMREIVNGLQISLRSVVRYTELLKNAKLLEHVGPTKGGEWKFQL